QRQFWSIRLSLWTAVFFCLLLQRDMEGAMIIPLGEVVQSQGVAQDSMGHSWGTQRQKVAIFGNKRQYRGNVKALIFLLVGVVRCWILLPSNPRVGCSSHPGGTGKSKG